MFIYKLINNINGDFYVGKTVKSLTDRFRLHRNTANHGSKYYIHNAMRHYGFVNFTIEPIETVDDELILNEREIYWIETLKPKYNMHDGGQGGSKKGRPDIIGQARENWLNGFNKKGKTPWNKGLKGVQCGPTMAKSDEWKRNIGEAQKRNRVACPHCGLVTNGGNISRYHGDKCKFKKN